MALDGQAVTVSRRAPTWVVVVLIVLGAILTTAAFPAVWVRNVLLDTDRYVQTVQPLASDPQVQAAVAARLETAIETNLDTTALLTNAGLSRPLTLVLGPPIQSAVESLADRVIEQTLTSDKFATFWTQANRLTHTALDRALRGQLQPDSAVRVDENGMLVVDLTPLLNMVRQDLTDRGLNVVAGQVPASGPSIQIADVSGLLTARHWVSLLNAVAYALPFVGLACFAGAVLLARRRRRTVIQCALAAALGLVVVGIGIGVGRHAYLDAATRANLSPEVSATVFDTLVRFLRRGLRVGFVIFLLIALVLIIWGRQPTPALQGWLNRNRLGIQVGIGAAALAVLLFWDTPSVWVVVSVVALAATVLLLFEHARRQPPLEPARKPTENPSAEPVAAG